MQVLFPSEQKTLSKGFVSGAEQNPSLLEMAPQLIQVAAARNTTGMNRAKSQRFLLTKTTMPLHVLMAHPNILLRIDLRELLSTSFG